MRPFFYSIVIILLSGSALAQTGESCARLEDGNSRLVCYDSVFRVDRQSPAEMPPGDWQVPITTSRIDDSTNVVLKLSSVNTLPARFGRSGNAHLYVRCMENTTSLYFVWNDHFLSDIQGYGEVTFRKDEEPARKQQMQVSTDNKALGLWRGGNAIPFIRSLFGGGNLLVQITPFNESRMTADFRIAGLEDAITPLREACNW